MTREEALGLESIVRYNLTATKHKEAVDVAFDALREQGKCAKSAHCTHADRIRAMSDEELAEFLLYGIVKDDYGTTVINKTLIFNKYDMVEWLEQPVKEDA